MGEIRNLFMSHIHEDDRHLEALKDAMANRGLAIRDASINSSRPNRAKDEDYIKYNILAPGIDWAGTVVVIVSPHTKDSWWVQWEIDYAQRTGTRIVGIYAPGAADCDLPDGLADYADSIVAWNGDRIYEAISGERDIWEEPDGRARSPQQIKRIACQ